MGQHHRLGGGSWLHCLDAVMLRDIVEESSHLSTAAAAIRHGLQSAGDEPLPRAIITTRSMTRAATEEAAHERGTNVQV